MLARLKALFRLIWQGIALLNFRLLSRRAFAGGIASLVLLLASNMVLVIAWERFTQQGGPVEFSSDGLLYSLTFTLLYLLLIGGSARQPRNALRLMLAYAATLLPLNLLQFLLDEVTSHAVSGATTLAWSVWWAVLLVPLLWQALALGRYAMSRLNFSARATLCFMIGFIALNIGEAWQGMHYPYWTPSYPPEVETPAPVSFNEPLFFRQSTLLNEALARLPAPRNGKRDVYILGIAGHGGQAVFDKEARLALATLSSRFEARGTLLLANRPSPDGDTPLATRFGVSSALQFLGKKMNPKEDLLILYMSSHGSKQFEFQLDQQPVDFEGITPDWLAAELRRANIQRRIVIVSACYSGGYVQPLANDDSLIMTAADTNHSSFGCSDDAELTWFGRALLTDALPKAASLEAAFPRLQSLIQEWEKRENFTPSNPQLFVGKRIRSWLAKSH